MIDSGADVKGNTKPTEPEVKEELKQSCSSVTTTTKQQQDEFFEPFQVVPPWPKSPMRICQFVGLSLCDLPPMKETPTGQMSARSLQQLAKLLSRPAHTNTADTHTDTLTIRLSGNLHLRS